MEQIPQQPVSFNIDQQFEFYLKLVKLDKRKMPANQIREMRNCFYGGIGQIIVLMRDHLSKLPDGEGEKVLQKMMDEIGNHFLAQNGKMN